MYAFCIEFECIRYQFWYNTIFELLGVRIRDGFWVRYFSFLLWILHQHGSQNAGRDLELQFQRLLMIFFVFDPSFETLRRQNILHIMKAIFVFQLISQPSDFEQLSEM